MAEPELRSFHSSFSVLPIYLLLSRLRTTLACRAGKQKRTNVIVSDQMPVYVVLMECTGEVGMDRQSCRWALNIYIMIPKKSFLFMLSIPVFSLLFISLLFFYFSSFKRIFSSTFIYSGSFLLIC